MLEPYYVARMGHEVDDDVSSEAAKTLKSTQLIEDIDIVSNVGYIPGHSEISPIQTVNDACQHFCKSQQRSCAEVKDSEFMHAAKDESGYKDVCTLARVPIPTTIITELRIDDNKIKTNMFENFGRKS